MIYLSYPPGATPLTTDVLLQQLSGETLTWGGGNIQDYAQVSEVRRNYIHALRQADKGDYQMLLEFVVGTA
ncbi:MAG: hypothetical protein CMF50_05835 [Legionellales bacterium]|nr:hypothetical protein [Legionellales bacterium]|tara:strand:+ start:43353 stop:43565 length:213 start_codon:yes stop_codon:yes gene_type:complete